MVNGKLIFRETNFENHIRLFINNYDFTAIIRSLFS